MNTEERWWNGSPLLCHGPQASTGLLKDSRGGERERERERERVFNVILSRRVFNNRHSTTCTSLS